MPDKVCIATLPQFEKFLNVKLDGLSSENAATIKKSNTLRGNCFLRQICFLKTTTKLINSEVSIQKNSYRNFADGFISYTHQNIAKQFA